MLTYRAVKTFRHQSLVDPELVLTGVKDQPLPVVHRADEKALLKQGLIEEMYPEVPQPKVKVTKDVVRVPNRFKVTKPGEPVELVTAVTSATAAPVVEAAPVVAAKEVRLIRRSRRDG